MQLIYSANMETNEDPMPLSGKIHLVLTTLVVMVGMGFLDGYLVELNVGTTRTGVFVMVLLADICLLLVLRYVAIWIGKEVHTSNRGCSSLEWILFLGAVVVKVFFIFDSVLRDCAPADSLVSYSPLKSTKAVAVSSFATKQVEHDHNDHDIHLDSRSVFEQDPVNLETFMPISRQCAYSFIGRKMLTLLQALIIGGLYLLLVGADHMRNLSRLRELEEMKMRSFWVLMDIFDMLDLQSSMWESDQAQLLYSTAGFVYFYCAFVLMFLPPLALLELCHYGAEMRPHRMLTYLAGSVVFVNVGSTIIRLVLIFHLQFPNVSSVFIGKNIICLGMKMFLKAFLRQVTKVVQINLIQRNRSRFCTASHDSLQSSADHSNNCIANGTTSSNCRNTGSNKTLETLRDTRPINADSNQDYFSTHDHAGQRAVSECSTVANMTMETASTRNEDSVCNEGKYRTSSLGRQLLKQEPNISGLSSITSGSNTESSSALFSFNSKKIERKGRAKQVTMTLLPAECFQSRREEALRDRKIAPSSSKLTFSIASLNKDRCSSLDASHEKATANNYLYMSELSSRSADDVLSVPTPSYPTSRSSDVRLDYCEQPKDLDTAEQNSLFDSCRRQALSDSDISDFTPPPPLQLTPVPLAGTLAIKSVATSGANTHKREWSRTSSSISNESTSV